MTFQGYANSPRDRCLHSLKPYLREDVQSTSAEGNPSKLERPLRPPIAKPSFLKSSNGYLQGLTLRKDFGNTDVSSPKFLLMKEMVERLLEEGLTDNEEVAEGLWRLSSMLRTIINEPLKHSFRCQPEPHNDQHKTMASLLDESTRMNSTLTRLIEISKSREIKEGLLAIKTIQERIIRQLQLQEHPPSILLLDSSTKGTRNNHSKNTSVEELLRNQIGVLKQEKINLMVELNREIQVSNKKEGEIKILEDRLCRLNKIKEEVPRMKRCLSTNLQPEAVFRAPADTSKEHQIFQLQRQNQDLKKQICQLKQLSLSESFLSEAFNFRDQQIDHEKEQHQKVVGELQKKIQELEKRVSGSQGMAMLHKSFEAKLDPALMHRISELQIKLMREAEKKELALRELEQYKKHQRFLEYQIALLKTSMPPLKTQQKQALKGGETELLKSPQLKDKSKFQSSEYHRMKHCV